MEEMPACTHEDNCLRKLTAELLAKTKTQNQNGKRPWYPIKGEWIKCACSRLGKIPEPEGSLNYTSVKKKKKKEQQKQNKNHKSRQRWPVRNQNNGYSCGAEE